MSYTDKQASLNQAIAGMGAKLKSVDTSDLKISGRTQMTGRSQDRASVDMERDPSEQAVYFVQKTLAKYTLDDKNNEIVQTYNGVNDLLHQLDALHTAIIQRHEADFVVGYKDHMVMI